MKVKLVLERAPYVTEHRIDYRVLKLKINKYEAAPRVLSLNRGTFLLHKFEPPVPSHSHQRSLAANPNRSTVQFLVFDFHSDLSSSGDYSACKNTLKLQNYETWVFVLKLWFDHNHVVFGWVSRNFCWVIGCCGFLGHICPELYVITYKGDICLGYTCCMFLVQLVNRKN